MNRLIDKPVPINQLPPPPKRGTDWLAIFRQIPPGYAQKVKASWGTVRVAISKLEKAGLIRPGEFQPHTRRVGNTVLQRVANRRETYVLHNKEPVPRKRVLKEQPEGK